MKMIKQYLLPVLIITLLMSDFSCKKRDIKGEVLSISNITLSLKSDQGQIKIPEEDTGYVKTPENITIPVRVLFSDAAPKRFDVGLSVDNDTINNLIAENKLPNTVLLQSQYYKLPSSLDVRFGLDHYDFNLVVDITAIERNYGKNLALAVGLNDPTKNDQLDQNKKDAIIIINTSKIIRPDEIHYIYFTNADTLLNIPQPGISYSQNKTFLTVPVGISLGGIPAGAFNVKISDNQDTVQKLISTGVLKGVHPLTPGSDYIFPDSINFSAGKGAAMANINVSVDSLVAHYNQKVAFALSLDYPSSHLLDSARRTVVVVLDPVKLVEFDITNDNSTYTVQRDNTQTGEVATNLIDNNITTKFLLFDFRGVWVQLEYPSAQVAGAYTLTSANDNMTYTGRNINAWKLLGSNDGTQWTTLDTETGNPFTANYQTVKYYFDNSVAYKYYRLDLESVVGGDGSLMQLAEWRLIRTPQK